MKWIDDRGQVIHVYRDVKSVLTSFYSYAKTFQPKAEVPISEFIKQSMCGRKNRPAYWQEMMNVWKCKKEVLQLDFDKIVKQTDDELKSIGKFLNLEANMTHPLLPKKMKSLRKFRLQRLFSFQPESTAILGVFNRESLKWQNVFSKDDLNFIEEETQQLK